MRKLKNDLLIRAAMGLPTERPPVWMMRQAGRILKEYLAVRNELPSFKNLVETPEKAAEVTLQPVDILGVDAAIIFSDILVVPEAMGCTYQMKKGFGPIFEKTVQSEKDIDTLVIAPPEESLKYVLDAIAIVRNELGDSIPLIGFAGAPWTILAYMVEGSGSKTFSKARKFLYTQPRLAHLLLDKITEVTIAYLKAQIKFGADIVQLFDSWAGILPHQQYKEFALRYIEKICNAIDGVPVTVFAKGAYTAFEDLAQLNCETLGVDWNMQIPHVREIASKYNKSLQGNLDPCILYANDKEIEQNTINMLKAFGNKRHIANLGHGVYPDTNYLKAKVFIDTVKNYRYESN